MKKKKPRTSIISGEAFRATNLKRGLIKTEIYPEKNNYSEKNLIITGKSETIRKSLSDQDLILRGKKSKAALKNPERAQA